MKVEEMIEEMNKAVDETVSITHYYLGWELHSYGDDSLFSYFSNGAIKAKSFKELIEKAYTVLKEKEKEKNEKKI